MTQKNNDSKDTILQVEEFFASEAFVASKASEGLSEMELVKAYAKHCGIAFHEEIIDETNVDAYFADILKIVNEKNSE